MQITTLPLGPLEANCYLVENDGAALVIDPGYPDFTMEEWVEAHKNTVRYILLTHGHFDHICAAEKLRQITSAPVCIGAADADAYNNDRLNLSSQMADAYPSTAHFAAPDILLHDGNNLPFGSNEIRCIHTPGHTVGGFCFAIGDTIFSGDTLFANSVGRTDFFGGSFSELTGSLKKIVEYCGNLDYRIYSGHGPETTMAREKKYNPYLVNL